MPTRAKKRKIQRKATKSGLPVVARLGNLRNTPRKVRPVADLIRGKNVEEALTILSFSEKRAARPLHKLLESAVASAEAHTEYPEDLIIADLQVDMGQKLRRFRPRAMGRATPVIKRYSQVRLVLDTAANILNNKQSKQG